MVLRVSDGISTSFDRSHDNVSINISSTNLKGVGILGFGSGYSNFDLGFNSIEILGFGSVYSSFDLGFNPIELEN